MYKPKKINIEKLKQYLKRQKKYVDTDKHLEHRDKIQE